MKEILIDANARGPNNTKLLPTKYDFGYWTS
jgi:hypothetical protein